MVKETEFQKYPKILAVGNEEVQELLANPDDEIVIQEKMDGANFRFLIYNNTLVFGSRNAQLTSDEGEDSNVSANFERCVSFVRDKLSGHDLSNYSGYIFYGECMVRHTISYNWEIIPPFLGFDIFDIKNNQFLSFQEAFDVYQKLGFDFVPIIGIVRADSIKEITDEVVPQSAYYDGQAEGIVYKNYRLQMFGKYVRAAFKEDNRLMFGGSKKHASTRKYFVDIESLSGEAQEELLELFKKHDVLYEQGDITDEKLTLQYCTNARIEKCIFKMIDDGQKLDMPMMKYLPSMVYEDIIEENWREFCRSGEVINFKHFRKLITNRCLNVLKQMITNNAINGNDGYRRV